MSAPSGWEITETAFDPERLAANESVFAVGGGTWLALVAGFGGLRDYDGEVAFSPRLPAGWSGLRFRLQVRGQLLEVDMRPAGTTYRLLEGRGLPIRHFGEALRPTPGTPAHRPANPSLPLPRAA